MVDARTMDRILRRAGFEPVRQKGSHVFYRHADGLATTVPHHPGRDLARPLVREILREADISVDRFLQLLHES